MIGPPRRRDRKPSLARPAPLFALLVALLGWATGCGSAFGQNGAALGPDAPVAADEPRATLRLQLTLPFAPDCEEAFDLALYANRGVELIAWDDDTGSCSERIVTIRYLPRRLSEAELVALVRQRAERVEVAEPTGAAEPASHATSTPQPSGTPSHD